MKNAINILVVAFFLCGTAQAQSTKTVDVFWQTEGAEPDVQYYQLYVGDSDTTLQRFGDPILHNPLNPDAPSEIHIDYPLEVPAGETVVRWFSVTAIDTSGNESALATPVSATVDNEAPGAPRGLTVTVRIVIVPAGG